MMVGTVVEAANVILYHRKKHVSVCHEHRLSDENKTLFENYKQRCILHQNNLPTFSKDIKISFVSYLATAQKFDTKLDVKDDGIILDNLHATSVDKENFTLFFDTGCSDMVCRYKAIQKIGPKAQQEVKGPIVLGGIGKLQTSSDHGIYQLRLPLHNGKNAVLSGICLEQITTSFPIYPLHGRVGDDIKEAYKRSGGTANTLPLLPECVGGEVVFVIGAKYFRYHPEAIFTLPSELTIYRSPFINADGGGHDVIGGPHEVFSNISKINNGNCQFVKVYLSEQCRLYKLGYQLNPDIKLLGIKPDKDFTFNVLNGLNDEVLNQKKENFRN